MILDSTGIFATICTIRAAMSMMFVRFHVVQTHHAVQLTHYRKAHSQPNHQKSHKLPLENSSNRLRKTFLWISLLWDH